MRVMAREFSKAFYKSKEWQQCREYILKRDNYLCVKCGSPADLEVHHIIHLSPRNINDLKVSLNPDNLQTLCRACHFEEHKGERGMQRINEEKYPYCFNEYGELVRKASPG